jgi:hypothetical protein
MLTDFNIEAIRCLMGTAWVSLSLTFQFLSYNTLSTDVWRGQYDLLAFAGGIVLAMPIPELMTSTVTVMKQSCMN